MRTRGWCRDWRGMPLGGSMTLDAEILYAVQDSIATITLNRPERLNAWTPTMADQLRHAVGEAGNDPLVRVIVITGAGRGFCAGADMGILSTTADRGKGGGKTVLYPDDVHFPNAPGPEIDGLFPGRFTYLFACPKPVIAAINGPCVGMGLILTLYCDFRYAAQTATLSTTFAARGLIAEHGLSWLLPRLVGETAAMDLLLSARKFTGAEAARIGLCNAAVPAEQLMAEVGRIAGHLATNVSPRSMAIIKRQIRLAYRQDLSEALSMANDEMAKSFTTPDFREGVRSFVERRVPDFPPV